MSAPLASTSPKTLSIGGVTYDLFVRIQHSTVHTCDGREAITLPLGDKMRVQEVIETNGGGACNTAVGLSRLGCEARFSGVIGDDQWGQALLKNFEHEGVLQDCITIVENEVSSFSIILSASSGERVILYDSGTNTHLHDVTFNRNMAETMDWVFLNHIQASTCVIEDDLIDIFSGDNSPNLTWNPGGCQIDVGVRALNNKLLLKETTVLLLNKQEAEKFTGESSLETALHVLLDAGVQYVCITDGSNGTVASDGTHRYHCPILQTTEAADTTGAGDAFGTGVTWALISGHDLPTALQAGTLNAASVVSCMGAQEGLLTERALEEQLRTTTLSIDKQLLES